MFQSIGQVFGLPNFCDERQITDTPANGHAELVGEYNTRERFALALPGRRNLKKILIASEEHATKSRRPGQQNTIVGLGMIVFFGGDDGQITGA